MTSNELFRIKMKLLTQVSIITLAIFACITTTNSFLIGQNNDQSLSNDANNNNNNDTSSKSLKRANESNIFSLNCEEWPQTELQEDLDDDCKMLKLFNRTELQLMELRESVKLARYCACQLNFLDHIFQDEFDADKTTRQLYSMVSGKLEHDHQVAQSDHKQHIGKHFSAKQHISTTSANKRARNSTKSINNGATYLWNDVDVTLYGISIYTSTKDYFDKLNDPKFKMDSGLKRQIIRDHVFKTIRVVCFKVAQDRKSMFQYLENLARLNPIIFLELTSFNEQIGLIYQASKACKLLLLEHLQKYKLRPSSPDFVPVANYPMNFDKQVILAEKQQQQSDSQADSNELSNAGESHSSELKTWDSLRNDVDLQLEKSSPSMLFACKQHQKLDMNSLEKQCPMMFEERISADWFKEHSRASDRSILALKCGCQLILHNSTWSTIMQDPSVQQMSKCLTMYLNQNSVPNFMTTPITTLYGWFMEIMHKFATNRLFTIRQMFDSSFEDGDPLKPINHLDDVKSLETLRRGCNLIMFNYNRNSRFTSELKLIKYLDRLQLLSQDNLFVFHLTLMDPNLFKLHALSKMCEPIIS